MTQTKSINEMPKEHKLRGYYFGFKDEDENEIMWVHVAMAFSVTDAKKEAWSYFCEEDYFEGIEWKDIRVRLVDKKINLSWANKYTILTSFGLLEIGVWNLISNEICPNCKCEEDETNYIYFKNGKYFCDQCGSVEEIELIK